MKQIIYGLIILALGIGIGFLITVVIDSETENTTPDQPSTQQEQTDPDRQGEEREASVTLSQQDESAVPEISVEGATAIQKQTSAKPGGLAGEVALQPRVTADYPNTGRISSLRSPSDELQSGLQGISDRLLMAGPNQSGLYALKKLPIDAITTVTIPRPLIDSVDHAHQHDLRPSEAVLQSATFEGSKRIHLEGVEAARPYVVKPPVGLLANE